MEEYKICPNCNFRNVDLQSLDCQKCGQDLSGVPISSSSELLSLQSNADKNNHSSQKEETASAKTLIPDQIKLVQESGDYEIKIPVQGGIIGREGTLNKEYFENYRYISRIHAQLFYNGATCVIVDKGSTNGTMVNNLKLEANKQHQLIVGDTVVFADVSFKVKAGN